MRQCGCGWAWEQRGKMELGLAGRAAKALARKAVPLWRPLATGPALHASRSSRTYEEHKVRPREGPGGHEALHGGPEAGGRHRARVGLARVCVSARSGRVSSRV